MYFISISGISIVDFKQVNVSWEMVFRNVHDDRSSSFIRQWKRQATEVWEFEVLKVFKFKEPLKFL